MKFKKRYAAAALVLLLMGSFAVPAFDEAESSPKEEVLYILTDASGRVTDIEAVNIFSGGSILDYGDYSALKPLNTTDRIEQNGSKITLSSSADRVYYQGTLKNTAIPWNLSLRYFLDGKELSPQELAGKSGALEIRFSVSKNESFRGRFYEDYALQASFTLSTDRCRNILASGATIANVGSDKQLTYTVLPGRGLDAVIRADVTDFEMNSVAINGVRLNLNLDLGEEELTERVDELISALEKLRGGAFSLSEGIGELSGAAGLLKDQTGDLSGGAGDLAERLLQSGYSQAQVEAYLQSSEGQAAVAQTAESFTDEQKEQIQAEALASLTEEQKAQIREAAIEQLMTSEEVTAQISAAVAQANEAAGEVAALKGRLDRYDAFYQGLLSYTGAVSDATDGAKDLAGNLSSLSDGTNRLRLALGEFHSSSILLSDGAKKLADGSQTLTEETSGLSAQLQSKLNDTTAALSGGGVVESFVSEKNTRVDSVQFVIKTAAIEKAETASEAASAPETLTFWQKLLRLFGLY